MSEDAPVLEIAKAVEATVVSPSVPVLVDDLLLVHQLVVDVKNKLAGKHVSLPLLFNTLFNIS